MAYIYDLTDTWNAGGTTFNAIKMNVTDSASAAASKLVTLQRNGTEHFSVTKAGVGYFSGNVGIGVTPSTWTDFTALQVGALGGAALGSLANNTILTSNAYYNSGFKYAASGAGATYYQQTSSEHRWFTAPSGTAGNAITFAERMRITSAGELLIGRSSASGLGKLNVEGGADFTGGNVLMCRDTGNVGIGTSSPGYKLQVASAGGGDAEIVASNTAGAERIHMFSRYSAANSYLHSQNSNLLFGTFDNYQLLIQTNNIERMRITTAGNVGIGTSSPVSKLEASLTSSAYWTGSAYTGTPTAITVTNTNPAGYDPVFMGRMTDSGGTSKSAFALGSVGTSAWTAGNVGTQTCDFYVLVRNNADALVERMRITSAGNIGIGTTSPSTKLHVAGDSVTEVRVTTSGNLTTGAASLLRFGGSNSATSGYIGYGGTSSTIDVWNSLAGSLTFGTSNLERMRIDSSGNLLVGTTSAIASGRISVQSTGSAPALVGRSASDSIQLYTTQTSGTSYFGYWVYNGTNVGSITSTGTTTAYNTSSDARLKHDIVDAPEASSLIDAIKVRSFKWNADNSEQRYGMIAQELLEVAPEAVSHDPDDEEKMMGVDYSKLVPMLVKEIQSLRARVAQLEGN